MTVRSIFWPAKSNEAATFWVVSGRLFQYGFTALALCFFLMGYTAAANAGAAIIRRLVTGLLASALPFMMGRAFRRILAGE